MSIDIRSKFDKSLTKGKSAKTLSFLYIYRDKYTYVTYVIGKY